MVSAAVVTGLCVCPVMPKLCYHCPCLGVSVLQGAPCLCNFVDHMLSFF